LVKEISPTTMTRKPDHRGERENKPLKPLRAGMPGDPGATVVTNACAFYFCARGCGCNGHPAFPTPSLGESFMHNPGASRRGIAKVYVNYSDVIARSESDDPDRFRVAAYGLLRLRLQ
jgi:hypothetical protein